MSKTEVERAINISMMAHKKNLLVGVDTTTGAGACILLAAKLLGVPRHVDEVVRAVAAVSRKQGTVKKRMLTCSRKLKRGLGLALPVVEPEMLFPQFVSIK